MRDFLIENHIWKDQDGKDKFLAKEKKITNEFWINFLGFLGLYAKYKDDIKLIQYFKQSTVRLDKVTDADSDLMVILKVINDKKVIPDMTITKITKMLAKIKMGSLGGLDENMFRNEIIRKIKISSLYPYPQISALLKDFKKGNKTLSDMLPELYNLAMQHKRAHEFRILYKRLSGASDGTQDAQDTAQTAQSADINITPMSPVKSALTGAPKPTPVPIKTQVVPTEEPKEVPAPTWQDITLYTNANQLSLELSTYYLLMYLVSNSKTSSDIQTIVRSLYIRYIPSRTVMRQFLFEEIPAEIKTQFPTIEKLYKPIKGDFSRLTPHFIDYAFSDSTLHDFRYMVRTLQMKDNIKDLYTTFSSLFIEDLKKYFSEWRGALKITSKVPDKYIDELDSILKSTFPDCLNEQNIIRSIVMLRGNDFETLIHGIYGDQKIEIVDYLGHFAEYLSSDTISAVISIESRSSKEIAKKWILLDDKKSAAYRWADSMLTLEDKIGDKLSYEILNSELVKRTNPTSFHEFYLKHLKDNNWTLKEYIEHYNLPYSEFIERVKSSNDDLRKYLTLAFFLHKEYQADHSYLIEDLAFETGPGFKWIDVYLSDREEFSLVGLYCLNYFAYKGNWTKFAYLVKTIERDSKDYYHPKYIIGEVKVIKNIFSKLNASMPEFLLFYTLLTKLIDDKFDMSTVQNWGIEADFIFKNPELFIDLNRIVSYRLQNFIKYFENSDYDLSKSIKIDAAIKTIIKEHDDSTYSFFSVKDYNFNLKTFNSYKDIWLEHVKYKIKISGLHILRDFNYLISKGFLDKAFVQQFLANNMDDARYKKNVYDYVYSSPVYEQDELKKSFALEYFDSKDKINDFLLNHEDNDWRLRNLNKSGYYTSKEATETIAEYLDRNSFMIGKLYDDYGVDALIEYFKNDNVQGVWDKISSGKRLLNKTNSLELILLDMLSDKNKLQKIDDLLDAFPDKISNSIVNTLKEQLLIYPILNDIFNDDNPLKPATKLTPARIKTLLKYNNFEFKGTMLRKKPREKWADYFVRVEQVLKGDALIPDINLEKIEETQDQLNEKTVEYSKYYNGKHGTSAVEFLESYNVNMKYPQFDQFTTRFGSNNLVPAFHASGLTASNFILRFGFTVIPATDSSTVGRMLDIHKMSLVKLKSEGDAIEDSNDYVEYLENGYFPVSSRESGKRVTYSDYPTDLYHWRTIDTVGGIYVTNVIEKAAQYLGDDGYSRREGTVGTIYECEVNLGEAGLHHHVAGTGNDSIRSPEWAVCWPQAQINIVKAHKVMFTTKKRIKELKAQYPHALKENKYFKRFADFLQEQEMIKSKNVVTFVFHQCTIPTEKNILPWDEYEKKIVKNSKKMYIDSNQYGIGVVFHTDRDLNGVIRVPFTDEFMVDDPEGLYSQFLMLVDECKG